MHVNRALVLILLFLLGHKLALTQIFNGSGTVDFISVAPLETIKASSDKLKGLIDFENQTFAFVLSVQSFEGFNSPLQKEHFIEHYLETKKHPNAEFSGKIIGMEDCNENCKKTVYAKGKLKIHGITRVITVPVLVEREDDLIMATADFKVPLYSYEITVPRILESKIAPDIAVHINAVFNKSDE